MTMQRTPSGPFPFFPFPFFSFLHQGGCFARRRCPEKTGHSQNSALTPIGKFHILAASRIYPRGWGRIGGLAGGEISADHEASVRRMEAGGALRTYQERPT